MSDHIDRAAEVIYEYSGGLVRYSPTEIAQVLDAANLLASPARDAARALREAADDLERRLSDPALVESADRYSGYYAGVRSAMQREAQLLHERADRIEREGGCDA